MKNKLPPQLSAVDFRALTSSIAKSVFPNGDPNFFIPSFRQSGNKDAETNPYGSNVWVYSACKAITTNLIPLQRVLDLKETPEKELITRHPALSLLEMPNPLMDGPTFWENVILNLMLPTKTTKGGQCFILSESLTDRPVNLRKGEIPREMYPFSDEFISPILSKTDDISLLGWKFQPDPRKPAILYKPEEVLRVFLVDPNNPLAGQSPIWAAKLGLRQDLKAQTLNERFFDNNASLGGVLETDAEINSKEGQELLSSFEERYAGQDNAGRIALLHSGVKYQMFQQTHQDMQFLDQRKWTREEVLAAYGVPKFNVGLYEDINFATAKAADKAFWQNTLVPLDKRILWAFTYQWIQYIDGGRYQLESDYSLVPALAADLTEKLDQAKKLFEMHVPMSEINDRLELQLNIDDYDWLQTVLVQASLKPAEFAMEKPELVEVEGDNMEDTDANNNDNQALPEPVEEAMRRIGDAARAIEKAENLKKAYVDEVLVPDEKKLQKVINNYLRSQRNLILDEIDKWGSSTGGKAQETKADGDKPFNIKYPTPEELTNFKADENKRLRKLVAPEYIEMALKEATVVDVELGGLGDWDITNPSMEKAIKQRLKVVSSINTTTFKHARKAISEVIKEAVEEGLSHKATVKLLKKEVNKVYKGRINAPTIARTETNSVHSATRMDIYKTNGITKIKWQTFGDEKVRGVANEATYPHDMLDGTIANIKEGFNNGETIMYPLDPNASPGNVINCRCSFISEA